MTRTARRNESADDEFPLGGMAAASSDEDLNADEYLAAVGQTMEEWNSKEDETAWRDL